MRDREGVVAVVCREGMCEEDSTLEDKGGKEGS